MERVVGHELEKIVVVSPDRAEYYCKCGAKGTATYGAPLHNRRDLEKRATFNHSLHRVRALIREGK